MPRPWGPDSERLLLEESLAQIELADGLGYDYAWEVEHHFLEEYSHSSAPEVFLGAASQRTRNIRLGHGVIQLTTNHPVRVAEKVSTLDLLSGGRVELGLGEAQGPVELHPFGVQVRSKRDRWIEGVKATVPLFTETAFEFSGEFYSYPKRNVVPKPLQKPHPPLWVACSNIETIEDAGRWGMGALGFQFVSPEAAKAWVNRYYLNLTCNLDRICDYPVNPNIAMVSGFMCCETDEEADRKGRRVDLLHLLPQPLRPARHLRPRRDRPLAALPGLAPHGEGAAGADRGPDRLAGNHPPQAARFRRRQCGPGDPAEPGRAEHA